MRHQIGTILFFGILMGFHSSLVFSDELPEMWTWEVGNFYKLCVEQFGGRATRVPSNSFVEVNNNALPVTLGSNDPNDPWSIDVYPVECLKDGKKWDPYTKTQIVSKSKYFIVYGPLGNGKAVKEEDAKRLAGEFNQHWKDVFEKRERAAIDKKKNYEKSKIQDVVVTADQTADMRKQWEFYKIGQSIQDVMNVPNNFGQASDQCESGQTGIAKTLSLNDEIAEFFGSCVQGAWDTTLSKFFVDSVIEDVRKLTPTYEEEELTDGMLPKVKQDLDRERRKVSKFFETRGEEIIDDQVYPYGTPKKLEVQDFGFYQKTKIVPDWKKILENQKQEIELDKMNERFSEYQLGLWKEKQSLTGGQDHLTLKSVDIKTKAPTIEEKTLGLDVLSAAILASKEGIVVVENGKKKFIPKLEEVPSNEFAKNACMAGAILFQIGTSAGVLTPQLVTQLVRNPKLLKLTGKVTSILKGEKAGIELFEKILSQMKSMQQKVASKVGSLLEDGVLVKKIENLQAKGLDYFSLKKELLNDATLQKMFRMRDEALGLAPHRSEFEFLDSVAKGCAY